MSDGVTTTIDRPTFKRAMWSTFARALDADLREDTVIRGVSGLSHQVEAIAVDDLHKRVIVVSAEPNPRMAALMQVDVQASVPDSKVLVVRPVAINLMDVLRRIVQPLGIREIDIARAQDWFGSLKDDSTKGSELIAGLKLEEALKGVLPLFVTMPAMPQLVGLLTQAGQLPWDDIGRIFSDTAATGKLDLSWVLAGDSLDADLRAGVCPVPLYELDNGDLDLFLRGTDLDAVRARLKTLGIHQYFYPPRDQLALGLVDHGLQTGRDIVAVGERAPTLGHPFGEGELVGDFGDFVRTLAALKEAGYLADAEFGMEVSDTGRTVRKSIKVRPREGLVTKIINRCSVSFSLDNLFK